MHFTKSLFLAKNHFGFTSHTMCRCDVSTVNHALQSVTLDVRHCAVVWIVRFVKCCEWRRGVIRITPSNSNPTSKANTSVTSQSFPSSSFSSSFSSSCSCTSSINFEFLFPPPNSLLPIPVLLFTILFAQIYAFVVITHSISFWEPQGHQLLLCI